MNNIKKIKITEKEISKMQSELAKKTGGKIPKGSIISRLQRELAKKEQK